MADGVILSPGDFERVKHSVKRTEQDGRFRSSPIPTRKRSPPASSATVYFQQPGGRLSATNRPLSGNTGATSSTIYYVPYTHGQVWLHDGDSTWKRHTLDNHQSGTVVSLALTGLTTGTLYDVFLYADTEDDDALTLETQAWDSSAARANELEYQDGAYVKYGDSTRLFLGTFVAASSTQFQDITSKRYLFNQYNRVPNYCQGNITAQTTSSTSYSNWKTACSFLIADAASNGSGPSMFSVNAHVVAASSDKAIFGVGVGSTIDSTVTPSAILISDSEDITCMGAQLGVDSVSGVTYINGSLKSGSGGSAVLGSHSSGATNTISGVVHQ